MEAGKIITIALIGLVLGITPIAMAVPDSNSIIEDGIEYYMQTDKSIYDLGESVEMLYRVTNLGDEDVTFEFTGGPVDDRCDYIVEKDGGRIWDNLGRPSTTDLTEFILSPLESRVFTHLWDMTDSGGNQITPGTYEITGSLDHVLLVQKDRYIPVTVSIEIIPEPATLLLFGMGSLILLRKKNSKNKNLEKPRKL